MVSEEEIPDYWEWKELGDIAKFQNGYGFSKTDWEKNGLPIIRIQNLTGSNDTLNYYSGEIDDKYHIEDGDILLSWSATLEVFEWNEGHALLNQHIYNVKPYDSKKKFIFYLLKWILNDLESHTHGSTMKHITKKRLLSIEAPIPPLKEQEMIAEKLDEIFDNIENIQNAQKLAEEKYEIAFNSALREYIPSKESEEKTIRFGDIGEIYGGGTPSRSKEEYWGGSIPWVSAKDMGERRISDSQDHMTEEAFENSSSAKEVPEDSLIFVMRSSILEHTFPVALTENEITINQDLKALIPKEEVDPEYLLYTLLRYEKRILKKCSKEGTTVASLDSEPLYDFELPLPSKEKQRKIVSKVKEIDSKLNSITDRVNAHNDKMEELPKSVLLEAFKGDLTDYQPEKDTGEQEREKSEQESFEGEGQKTLQEL